MLYKIPKGKGKEILSNDVKVESLNCKISWMRQKTDKTVKEVKKDEE